MEELEVPSELPMWAVADNASNMRRGVRESRFDPFHCLNHWQQLAILDAFKEHRDQDADTTMGEVSDQCKRLAEHLHRSEASRKLLTAECKKVGHYPKSVPQANDTRWDSRHDNMKEVLYHEDCLVSLARQGKLMVKEQGVSYSLIPSHQEFNLIRAGVIILEKCRHTTKVSCCVVWYSALQCIIVQCIPAPYCLQVFE